MSDFDGTSVETTEVADPSIETGVEEQEVANPVSEESAKSDSDAAFARMRRESQQYQEELNAARAELEELKAQSEARNQAFNRLTGSEDGEIAALAEVTGMSEDEIRAEMEAAQESAQKDLKIDQLEQKLQDIEVRNMMQSDLTKIQSVDPSVKSLEDLGEGYVDYIAAGLDPVKAYWAIKAEEGANHRQPPKAMGKVATGTAEKDYFTDAEIDAMSSDQLTKNWKQIMASWDRNKK
jgi:predicted RNase H-like nuclease (RuvC/YqgF family)